MNRILFLVKNYIGFGHIRRTVLIAEQIKALSPDIDIIFISQAKSLLLLQNTSFKVVNFPFLHRLPNNAIASVYETLLNQIIVNLNPTLIIEDTYPDEWYLSVPALQNVPKVLVLRRIDTLSLNNFRREGYFSLYDRVLVVQDREEFFADKPLPENDLLIRLSDIFRFVGPIFHLPTDDEINHVKRKYARQSEKLIVVNAGAGGDHFNDAYCERLFISVNKVARRFLDQCINPPHFVFVVGPYYRGTQPGQCSNVTVIDFEPNLSALLHIADVAIIRPGYNVTQETLAGSARAILIPGVSYMESQHLYVEYLAKKCDRVRIGNYDKPNLLFDLVKELLEIRSASYSGSRATPCQTEAARAIIEELANAEKPNAWVQRCEGVKLFLLVGNTSPKHAQNAWNLFRERIPKISLVAEQIEICDQPNVVNLDYFIQSSMIGSQSYLKELPVLYLQSTTVTGLTPKVLVDKGVRLLLYTSRTSFGAMAKEWCNHYNLRNYGMLEMELYHFQVMPSWDFQSQLSYRVSKLALKKNPVTIYLDLSLLTNWAEIDTFVNALSSWEHSISCCLLSLNQMVKLLACSQLA